MLRTMPRLIALALLVMLLCLVPLRALADQSVTFIVYFSPTCEHCALVRAQVLEPLQQAYGSRLVLTWVDVTQPDGLKKLEAQETRLGQRFDSVPIIQFDDRMISNEDPKVIDEELRKILKERLGEPAQGAGAAATPSPSGATPAASGAASKTGAPINLAYVQKDGCAKCARAEIVLEAIQKQFPSLIVTTFNDVRDAELVEEMGQYLGLPDTQRLVAPAVYVGKDALIDEQINSTSLTALLDKYAATGSEPFWQGLSGAQGRNSILSRFRSMGPLTVIFAAAVDSINPCAFATIIFFVSYLAISKRPRREMIFVGLTFTAGVFLTYLAVGLGAMSLLRLANQVRILATVLYGVMALGCLVFAGLSAYDYFLARQGRLKDMRLNLPKQVRERIKGRLRTTTSAVAGTAFVSGFIVSLLELACTGQVYLPTISFVVGVQQLHLYAVAYLVLYNVIFVLPLVIILGLCVYGISAARFQDWFTKNTATTKILLAVLFLLLGVLLAAQAISSL